MKRSFLFLAALLCIASVKLYSSNEELVFENAMPVATRSVTPGGGSELGGDDESCAWDGEKQDCVSSKIDTCLPDAEGGCSGASITPPR